MEDHHETTPHEDENENDNRLSSTFATAEIPPDISDAPQHETPLTTADHELEDIAEYSSSSSSRRHSAAIEGFLGDGLEDQLGAKSASSRSSLSSIPDSVVVHPKEHQALFGRDSIGTTSTYEEQEYMNYNNPAVYQKIRDRNSPFRHPSSVKAIQMQTEDEEDEDYKSPSRRRGAGFLGSPTSVRSLGSPLLRRHGYHSAGGTPKKSPVKRENPLVLLHCTILPPTVVLAPDVSLPERKILEKVLPSQYWRRWKLLEEKIVASTLLRDRGLLIQHPQEDYGLLEERVLENLELQQPRLQNGHFVDRETSDSESETETKIPMHKEGDERSCADCGCHVNRREEQQKWDVKFYAANGLMKEGAWTAAWKEIERVDVQVSLWLPYEVKNEVERKIQEENLLLAEQQQQQQQQEEVKAAQPVVNEREPDFLSQDQIDGLDDAPKPRTKSSRRDISGLAYPTPGTAELDLHTLVINSLRVLASDRRTVITAASMLIAVLAVVFGGRLNRRTPYGSQVVQFGDFPAVSTQVYYTSSASSVLTQISTEIPLPETENGMEGPREIQRVAQGVKEEVVHDAVSQQQPTVEPEPESESEVTESIPEEPIEKKHEEQVDNPEKSIDNPEEPVKNPEAPIQNPEPTENPEAPVKNPEELIEKSENIRSDHTIPEPEETHPVETIGHEASSPSSISESDLVADYLSSIETEPPTEPSSEPDLATAQNDNDEAT
jgi:hypothetical protein